MRRSLGVLAVAAVLGLTGCGGAAQAGPTADPAPVFLSVWHTRFPAASDKDAIAVAHSICDAYKAGTSFADEVRWLVINGGPTISGGDAGAMIGYAVGSYCPEYSNRH
jgi:hypothetical protein